MRALVVYESMFGNTQAVASAIAQGMSTVMSVDLHEVGTATTSVGPDVDLVVVGGPTHAFSMSRPNTRKSAAELTDGPVVSTGRGLREWLDEAGPTLRGVPAATFDTKITKIHLPGSAAKTASRRLHRYGARILAAAHSFTVMGTPGPLADGELARARQWGTELAALRIGTDPTRAKIRPVTGRKPEGVDP
jgi:flavodoxin